VVVIQPLKAAVVVAVGVAALVEHPIFFCLPPTEAVAILPRFLQMVLPAL